MNPFADAFKAGVLAIDGVLQRHYQVSRFSDDPVCILKVALTACPRDRVLGDGTRVSRGMPILELHLWNERLPRILDEGPTLAWAVKFLRRFKGSLVLLAGDLACHGEWDAVRAVHGEFGFLDVGQVDEVRRILELLGFEFIAGDKPGFEFWRAAFWQNLFSSWLERAFNPVSGRGKHLSRRARGELWMSRAELVRRFGRGRV